MSFRTITNPTTRIDMTAYLIFSTLFTVALYIQLLNVPSDWAWLGNLIYGGFMMIDIALYFIIKHLTHTQQSHGELTHSHPRGK